MNRQDIFEWCRQRYGTEPDYPWNDWNAVLRHADNNKWYGIVIEVDQSKLGIPGNGKVDVLNLKCDPALVGSLRMQPGFYPAYHMNKENWISVLLDGPTSDEEITELLALSYQMTDSRRKQESQHVTRHPV